ncbi:MAG: hypothetical protein ACPF8V_08870 [Luteibaculum sp.]
MRILVISRYKNVLPARPEASIFLALQKRPDVQVDVITDGESPLTEDFRKAGMQVSIIHPEKKYEPQFRKTLRQMLKTKGYDILHLFNSKATINGLAASKGLDVKICLYRGYAGNIHWYDPTAYFAS